jgi:hypothetical protein
MKKRVFGVLALSLVLTVSCGDSDSLDGGTNNGGTNNGGTNNVGTNNGGTNNGGTNNGGTNNGGTNNGGTNNGGTNNGGTNNGGTNNGGTNNGANNGGEDSCESVPSGTYVPAEGDVCDAIGQWACGDGEGCYLGEEGAVCVPAGDKKCGESCTNANDCQPGMICVNNPGVPGVCRPICEVGGECSGDGQCAPLRGRDDLGVCVLPVVGETCSVLEQNCPDGEACYLSGEGQECVVPGGMVGLGESCAFANECAPGLVCVGSDAENSMCLSPCATDGSVPCEAGECAPIQGIDDLGVCVTG